MRTGGEGVKKSQHFADVIYGWPLSKPDKNQLTFLAADLRVAGVALRAVAEGRVLEDPAVGVPAAVARVHAVPVQAGLLLRALAVGLAPHDDGGS